MITAASSLVDVAFEVCTTLDHAGVTAVMTGGSAATLYAPDAYQSKGIDFVIRMSGAGGHALLALGYRRSGDYYVHDDSPFPLEFPPGPLMVGDDRIERWDTQRRAALPSCSTYSPSDSCRPLRIRTPQACEGGESRDDRRVRRRVGQDAHDLVEGRERVEAIARPGAVSPAR